MLDLTISIKGTPWHAKRRAFATLAELCLGETLYEEGLEEKTLGISAVLCGDDFMQRLNKTYRGKDAPTNVLAFPELPPEALKAALAGGAPVTLGDLVISGDAVLREAREQGKEAAHHLAHLLVHGTLHLLGHDHEEDAQALRMEAKEVKILRRLGVGDPYR